MRLAMCVAVVALASPVAAQAQPWRLDTGGDFSATLDCLEAANLTLISAHRGGPTPGLPENSIEAMDALLHATPMSAEIDVAASRDGVLFLLHDNTLDRTTTGTGEAAAQDWATLSRLRLRDEAGWTTPYRIPTLEAALAWAKGKTALTIDFKRSAPYEDVIDLIRAADMAQEVMLVAYSLDAAQKLHMLAPDMLISLSMERPGALDEAVAAGIAADRLVAFTGTRTARPDLYRVLDDADVEVIFGTLGRADSIDNQLDRYGIDSRYADLGAQGVDIIATDRPRAAAVALAEAGRLPRAGQCGFARAAP